MTQIGIIGLGLIGTSLALALKAGRSDLTISGYDRENAHANQGRKMGAIDTVERSPEALAERADVVIVATPIIAIRRIFQEIAPALRPGTVVTDVASVKVSVMEAAAEILPDHVHFVGGHPMAGSHASGPEAATAKLFVDEKGRPRTYVIVPSVRASDEAIRTVQGIADIIGAKALILDANDHDGFVGVLSHLPILASVALFTLARGSKSWDDMAPFAGPAFSDLTRLARGNPEMALDIFAANRENVVHWLGRYQEELGRIRDLIEDDEEQPLHEFLLRAQTEREVFEEGEKEQRERTTVGDQFMTMMIGERLAERSRQITANFGKIDHTADRLKQRERERRQAQDNGQHENGSR